MRTLVVDDSRGMRSILRRFLSAVGSEVVEAANGLEALERMDDSGPFDLALVDWNMPELDGPGFLRELEKRPHKAALKTLMVTSMSDPQKVAEALMLGADDYLMKPFDEDALLAKLSLVGIEVKQR